MKGKVLFIAYDGLTDPLGQSQVLPYVIGLSKKGYKFSILSTEKRQNYSLHKEKVNALLEEHRIRWEHVFFSNKPPIISTLYNLLKLKSLALRMVKEDGISIIHCRSIIPGIIGFSVKKKVNAKLIFDIRGFWADERVEGGLWNLKNPIYRIVYNYFKKKEAFLFRKADYIITLTENAKEYILTHCKSKGKIKVIPCCVDIEHFDPNRIKADRIKQLRDELGFNEEDYVLCYIGSLGARYLLREMLLFFKQLQLQKECAKFLIVSKSDTSFIDLICEKERINKDLIKITSCEYHNVPNYISLSHASIFFIVSSFSGKAASPTKQAEVMSLGIPIITNSGLGDTDLILEENDAGIIVKNYSSDALKEAVIKLNNFNPDKDKIREAAIKLFSLKNGIALYHEAYENL